MRSRLLFTIAAVSLVLAGAQVSPTRLSRHLNRTTKRLTLLLLLLHLQFQLLHLLRRRLFRPR